MSERTWAAGNNSVYGGVSTGNVGKFNMNVDFNVRDVRKIDTDGSTNMYGPRRYLNFNSTYRFDDHSGIEAGVSFLKEQYRTFTSGTPDSTTWYDNNRQDYHVKYFGFDDKNDYEFQVYYDRLGKEPARRGAAIGRALTMPSMKRP